MQTSMLELRERQVGPWPMNTYALICPTTHESVLFDPGADLMCLIRAYLHAGGIVGHLSQSPFTYDVEAPDQFKGRLPIPHIGTETEVLVTGVEQGKTHRYKKC